MVALRNDIGTSLTNRYNETSEYEFPVGRAKHGSRDTGSLDPDPAGRFVEQARLGALAPSEAAELDSYIHVNNLLAVMQSKARQSLRFLEE
jgi:hypothetical protein